MDEFYLPILGCAVAASALVVLIRRGALPTRIALVVVAMLPVHALAAMRMPDRYCLLHAFGRDPGCIESLSIPEDMLKLHVAAAVLACVLALIARATRGRRPARAPSSAAR